MIMDPESVQLVRQIELMVTRHVKVSARPYPGEQIEIWFQAFDYARSTVISQFDVTEAGQAQRITERLTKKLAEVAFVRPGAFDPSPGVETRAAGL